MEITSINNTMMTRETTSLLSILLLPRTVRARKFIDSNGSLYSFEKKFDATFQPNDRSFVIRIKSRSTGVSINVNLESDHEYKVLIGKSKSQTQ